MQVDIWSDIVCPWCYIGKRRFEAALTRFAHRDEVEVRWRSFELDPSAPDVRTGQYAERLAGKYGCSATEAQKMIDTMTQAAAGDGVTMRFDLARPGNTFAAHRLLHLAAESGLQDELKERLLAGYLTEGEPIGQTDALKRLATDAGLASGDVEAVLDSDAYADDVRDDERQATALGISGVPFFVVDGKYGVSGAQSPGVLLEVLEQAWAQRRPPVLVGVPGTGSANSVGCEGDNCVV